MLKATNIRVFYRQREIVKGVTLSILPGEIVILMGQNGSGKSTLANALMNHPDYLLKKGKVRLDKLDITHLSAADKVKQGLFLAWQAPVAIPGVSFTKLVAELNLQNNITKAIKELRQSAKKIELGESFLIRGLNDGFSGGERKKLEMLQAIVLSKKYVIFDEIDTGLDVDALKIISKQINELKKRGIGCLVITHYHQLVDLLEVDKVLVMKNGKIVREGTKVLANKIQKHGYSFV